MSVKKRGQQSSIALVLILIFIALVIIVLRIDAKLRQAAEVPQPGISTIALSNHMQECLTVLAQNAAQKLMLTGGTFEKQPPIYTDFKQWNVPSLETMEQKLGAEIDTKLPSCTDTFVTQYRIEKGLPSTKVSVSGHTILVESAYPLTLIQGKQTTTVSVFSTAVEYNLQGIAAFTKTYMDMQAKKQFVLLEPLLTIAKEQGFDISLKQAGSTVQFSLADMHSTLQPNAFQFLITYDWSSIDGGFSGVRIITPDRIDALGGIKVEGDSIYYADFEGVLQLQPKLGNRPPVVEPIPPQHLQVGNVWRYKIKATDPDGDPLTFSLHPKVNGMTLNNGYLVYGPTSYDHNVTATLRVADRETYVEIPLRFDVYYSVPLPKVIRSGQTSGINQGLLGKVY